jgi:hypothetical protein
MIQTELHNAADFIRLFYFFKESILFGIMIAYEKLIILPPSTPTVVLPLKTMVLDDGTTSYLYPCIPVSIIWRV